MKQYDLVPFLSKALNDYNLVAAHEAQALFEKPRADVLVICARRNAKATTSRKRAVDASNTSQCEDVLGLAAGVLTTQESTKVKAKGLAHGYALNIHFIYVVESQRRAGIGSAPPVRSPSTRSASRSVCLRVRVAPQGVCV